MKNTKKEKHVNAEFENKLLKEVRRGASEGSYLAQRANGRIRLLISVILVIAIIVAGFLFIQNKFFKKTLRNPPGTADSHDLVLEDHGTWGYTAADFEEAILGDEASLRKLEVFSSEVSDSTTITKAGLFHLKIFSKEQSIIYNGTAIYSVDLRNLSISNINVDNNNKTVTLYVPKGEWMLSIQPDEIKFEDIKHGILSFGDLKITPQESATIQEKIQKLMMEKVMGLEDKAQEAAMKEIRLLYSSEVNCVAKDYSLQIKFK